ncbi:SGNH/GDSL hydrolase family protein [Abyssicoccus albus]|uniref:SGNH/GDSL hydrolase family protein n=1 Tax=Abyssicoccus albus TaxID=1817405 RepID=UPI00097E2F10|nr:SGNH/GDSL hydrolase family protein [Abyssicoccus albus]AQL56548.1 hypothetical protein BVH56_06250 [Abyssicoccus albus]
MFNLFTKRNKHHQISTTEQMNLLIFGDSITETATMDDDGSNYKEGVRSNWPKWLLQDISFKSVRNMAKAGATYKDRENVPLRKNMSVQVNSAIKMKYPADMIIIAMGTNDGFATGNFETAMNKPTLESLDRSNLYEALRWSFWTIQSEPMYANAEKFVALPIQRADREVLPCLHEAISVMSKRYGFQVIDMTTESQIIREFEVWDEEGRDLYDGLHPNAQGQQKMANVFKKHINHLISK